MQHTAVLGLHKDSFHSNPFSTVDAMKFQTIELFWCFWFVDDFVKVVVILLTFISERSNQTASMMYHRKRRELMLMSTAMQALFTILHRNVSWSLVKELKDVISEIPWRYVDKRLCLRRRQGICYHYSLCLKEFPLIWLVNLL